MAFPAAQPPSPASAAPRLTQQAPGAVSGLGPCPEFYSRRSRPTFNSKGRCILPRSGLHVTNANTEGIMQRNEILNRYRHLRAISTRHHGATLDRVARPAILERAKHLGLAYGQTLVAESEEAMTLIFDLAIHTAKSGRSRAIDRYAKAVALSLDPDEARTWTQCVKHSSQCGGSNATMRWLA